MENNKQDKPAVERFFRAIAREEGYGWRDVLDYVGPIFKAATIPFYSMEKACKKVGAPSSKNVDLVVEAYKAITYVNIGLILSKNIYVNGKSLLDYLF